MSSKHYPCTVKNGCSKHGKQTESDYFVHYKVRKSDGVRYISGLTCKTCRRESPTYKKKQQDLRRGNPKYLEIRKRSRDKCRLEVLQHYSENEKPFCSCCKENNLVFLALDHIYGGGNEHRRQLGGSKGATDKIYRWARQNNFPPIFRVLCHNCNFAFSVLGSCPHSIN